MPDSAIPVSILNDAKVVINEKENNKERYRMDIIWVFLKEKFPRLSKFALTVLTVPHNNVTQERVFSMVRKNNTEFRANLDMNRSLNSILRIKMGIPESLNPCHRW